MPNVVDSSACLEYLANGPNAAAFEPAIEDVPRLAVPTLVMTEVLRRLDVQGRRRVWTQDADLRDLPKVEYRAPRKGSR